MVSTGWSSRAIVRYERMNEWTSRKVESKDRVKNGILTKGKQTSAFFFFDNPREKKKERRIGAKR